MDKLHRILLLVVVVSCAVGWAVGQDYEDERAAPPVRARPPRGPIVPSRANKQAVQKTSTTEAPAPEPELEEYEDELVEEEPTTTTTTEAPRKGLRGGVLRPFRSNEDLIEALKRRRAQAQGNGGNGGSSYNQQSGSSTTTTTTTESSRQGRKSKGKFSRGGSATSTTEQPLDEQPAPRSRAFARGRRF